MSNSVSPPILCYPLMGAPDGQHVGKAEEEEARKVLWKGKVPEILQKLYENETDEEVNEILERCADIFISNQGSDGEDDAVGTVEEMD